MALRSFYVLHSGVVPPADIKIDNCSTLLTLGDLWQAARVSRPALLFRVRAEGDVEEALGPGDRFESCVGIVDAAVRWRSVFSLLRMHIMSIRHQPLGEVCSKTAEYLATRHPSSIGDNDRRAAAQAIAQAVEGATEHEAKIAEGLTHLVFCDNDSDAAAIVPILRASVVGLESEDEQRDRVTSVETLASAVLLSESAQRLAERAPVWLSEKMPVIPMTSGHTVPIAKAAAK
jgi:hypothetical protein